MFPSALVSLTCMLLMRFMTSLNQSHRVRGARVLQMTHHLIAVLNGTEESADDDNISYHVTFTVGDELEPGRLFVENLMEVKPLETPFYSTVPNQQIDFVWYRASGIRCNIGITKINIASTYESRLHKARRPNKDASKQTGAEIFRSTQDYKPHREYFFNEFRENLNIQSVKQSSKRIRKSPSEGNNNRHQHVQPDLHSYASNRQTERKNNNKKHKKYLNSSAGHELTQTSRYPRHKIIQPSQVYTRETANKTSERRDKNRKQTTTTNKESQNKEHVNSASEDDTAFVLNKPNERSNVDNMEDMPVFTRPSHHVTNEDEEKKIFRKIITGSCRSPLPDYYILSLEIISNVSSSAVFTDDYFGDDNDDANNDDDDDGYNIYYNPRMENIAESSSSLKKKLKRLLSTPCSYGNPEGSRRNNWLSEAPNSIVCSATRSGHLKHIFNFTETPLKLYKTSCSCPSHDHKLGQECSFIDRLSSAPRNATCKRTCVTGHIVSIKRTSFLWTKFREA